MTSALIDQFIDGYRREYDFYEQAAKIAHGQLENSLQSSGIRAMVTYRAKNPESLRNKLIQRNPEKGYRVPKDIYADIVDLSGIRVALYFPGEEAEVEKIIKSLFEVNGQPHSFPKGVQECDPIYKKRFLGYFAKHFRVKLRDLNLQTSQKRYLDASIEIQVASVLMHSWAEVEHDLIYKPNEPLSEDEHAILDELNGLMIAGEIALNRLQRAGEARVMKNGVSFSNHFELATYLLKILPSINADGNYSILGSVDILYEFLEAIGRASPEGIKEYASTLIVNFEGKSISDQIIDRVISVDDKYLTTYKNIKSRRDKTSIHPMTDAKSAAVSNFIKTFASYESATLKAAEAFGTPGNFKPDGLHEFEQNISDGDTRAHLMFARKIRNKIVHGDGEVTLEELEAAGKIAKAVAERLVKATKEWLDKKDKDDGDETVGAK